jgi:hypothetical protein
MARPSSIVSCDQAGWAMPTKAPDSTARRASPAPVSPSSAGAKSSGSPAATICHSSPTAVIGAWSSAPISVVKLFERSLRVSATGQE